MHRMFAMCTVTLLVFTFFAKFCCLFALFTVMMLFMIATIFLMFLLLAVFFVVVFAGVLLVVMSLLGFLMLVPNLVSLQTINKRSLLR